MLTLAGRSGEPDFYFFGRVRGVVSHSCDSVVESPIGSWAHNHLLKKPHAGCVSGAGMVIILGLDLGNTEWVIFAPGSIFSQRT